MVEFHGPGEYDLDTPPEMQQRRIVGFHMAGMQFDSGGQDPAETWLIHVSVKSVPILLWNSHQSLINLLQDMYQNMVESHPSHDAQEGQASMPE